MNTRRNFLKLGALFVPAAILAPRVVYSFLWAPRDNVFQFVEGQLAKRRLVLQPGPHWWMQTVKEKLEEYQALGWIA